MGDAVIVLERRCAAGDQLQSNPEKALQLPLTAEQRTVLRGRRQTPCGRDVLLQLPRDGALQPGDRLTDAKGSLQVEVVAAPEALLRVEAASPLELLQAAYHLGNRHVAIPQVISRLQQLQRAGRLHPQQSFRGRHDFHLQRSLRIGQTVARLQRTVSWQLQQHVATTGGLSTTPQHRALFRRQRQLQRLLRIRLQLISGGTTPLQHDHGVAHRHSRT